MVRNFCQLHGIVDPIVPKEVVHLDAVEASWVSSLLSQQPLGLFHDQVCSMDRAASDLYLSHNEIGKLAISEKTCVSVSLSDT